MFRLIRMASGSLVACAGAFFTYIFSGSVTAALPFNAAAAVCSFILLCRWTAGVSWRVSSAIAIFLIAVLFVAASFNTVGAPEASDDQHQVLQALARATIPLQSVDAGSGFKDLAPLGPILGTRRIIAMGEATHGTSEFFRMKHRMVEFLVTTQGYRDYAMEVSQEDGDRLNAFINGEDVDLNKVLHWPWATQEVAAQLRWMREYNAKAAPDQQIRLHGIDPRSGKRDAVMAANVSALVDKSSASKIVLWSHNGHISGAPGAMGFHLKQRFGDSIYRIGFEFDHGSWTSRTQVIHTFNTPPAGPDFYAWSLAKLPCPVLFLDFAMMQADETARAWVTARRRSHLFQELHLVYRLVPAWHTVSRPWPELYDGVLFIRTSTPARALGTHQACPDARPTAALASERVRAVTVPRGTVGTVGVPHEACKRPRSSRKMTLSEC